MNLQRNYAGTVQRVQDQPIGVIDEPSGYCGWACLCAQSSPARQHHQACGEVAIGTNQSDVGITKDEVVGPGQLGDERAQGIDEMIPRTRPRSPSVLTTRHEPSVPSCVMAGPITARPPLRARS